MKFRTGLMCLDDFLFNKFRFFPLFFFFFFFLFDQWKSSSISSFVLIIRVGNLVLPTYFVH